MRDIYTERMLHASLSQIMIGEEIGKGIHRTVYSVPFLYDGKRVVAKVATEMDGIKANFLEYEAWWNVMNLRGKLAGYKKFFAPVIEISNNGCILIQERTEPLRNDELPKKVPKAFTDLKKENWGMLRGHPCCHDYANNLAWSLAICKGMRNFK